MNLLSSTAILGGVGLILLFALCFIAVHTPSLLKKRRQSKPIDEPAQEPPKTEVEPIYYIVEKKKKRARDTYSPPQQIHFK